MLVTTQSSYRVVNVTLKCITFMLFNFLKNYMLFC